MLRIYTLICLLVLSVVTSVHAQQSQTSAWVDDDCYVSIGGVWEPCTKWHSMSGVWSELEASAPSGGVVSYGGIEYDNDSYSTTTPTQTVPATVSDGDLLFLAFSSDDEDRTIVWDQGWAGLTSVVVSSHRLQVGYKIAASEPVDYTFTTVEGGLDSWRSSMLYVTKDTGTWTAPSTYTSASGSGSNTLTSAAINVADDELVITFWGDDDTASPTTLPPTMTHITPYPTADDPELRILYEEYTSAESSVVESITWDGVGDLSNITISVGVE